MNWVESSLVNVLQICGTRWGGCSEWDLVRQGVTNRLSQTGNIIVIKYIKIMSGKSKKTTADKTVCNEKETKYISQSANKMINRLSLSFYGENTLKMNKQVILDTYDDLDCQSPLSRLPSKPNSLSKGKLVKVKSPIVRISKAQSIHTGQSKNYKAGKVEPQEKKTVKNVRERSSSRSSRGKQPNSNLFNYITNRMDGNSKGWSVLRAQSKVGLSKKAV